MCTLFSNKAASQATYKLTYFPFRARGENARQMFALAGVKYEDYRVPIDQWRSVVKATTPFGQMPVLEVDGKPLAQSNAVSRYLANTFGFAGANDWESAQIDAIGDLYGEYAEQIRPYIRVVAGFMPGDTDALFRDHVEPARDKFFPIICRYLKENTSGFLIGDKVSWVDLLIAENVATLEELKKGIADKYPEAIVHQKKIHSIPALKKWIESRPKSPC